MMTKEQKLEWRSERNQNIKLHALQNYCLHLPPVDCAELMTKLTTDEKLQLLRMLPAKQAVDTFAEMSLNEQKQLLPEFTDTETKDTISQMAADDAADMLRKLPVSFVQNILSRAEPEDRKYISQLLQYPEDSAGAIMTTGFISFAENMTVEKALAWIQQHGREHRDIYTAYIISAGGNLLGVVSLRDMLLSNPDTFLRDLMTQSMVKTYSTDDRERVFHLFERYDLTCIPVTDLENRLIGVITVDDAIDGMREETTEDFQKMAATKPEEGTYLHTSVMQMVKNRFGWLLVLMISDLISGGIIGSFQGALTALPVLITFIPMLTDTGGNAGSQSSTLVIRGMALHEIQMSDAWKVIWKELRVATCCGAGLAFVNFIRIYLQYPGQSMVGLTVAIAMVFTVIMAKSIGGFLPILAAWFKMDPAIMASPLITTIVDAGSLIIYFNVAHILLRL